jgi:protease I
MKRALIILPQHEFRDEEFEWTYKKLIQHGIEVTIASHFKGACFGVKGSSVEAAQSIANVNVFPFDALIFIGGPGAEAFFDDTETGRLIDEAIGLNRWIGAICLAPKILALNGVLNGLKFTSTPSAVKEIVSLGGVYKDDQVVVDKNIITSKGPQSAIEFGDVISEKILEGSMLKRTLLDGYNRGKFSL